MCPNNGLVRLQGVSGYPGRHVKGYLCRLLVSWHRMYENLHFVHTNLPRRQQSADVPALQSISCAVNGRGLPSSYIYLQLQLYSRPTHSSHTIVTLVSPRDTAEKIPTLETHGLLQNGDTSRSSATSVPIVGCARPKISIVQMQHEICGKKQLIRQTTQLPLQAVLHSYPNTPSFGLRITLAISPLLHP